ncbi:hypothetical protein [Moraxella phage Mcat9]|nr:hypothetical protein [Moraxella phage Mcat9]
MAVLAGKQITQQRFVTVTTPRTTTTTIAPINSGFRLVAA